MADSSEIGRYGTLRLLKRHAKEDTTIAVFPIDDEEVTFGRNQQCSLRLYYDYVSELHCTLSISEDRKAFLTVHGTNGVKVDGCEVKPPTVQGAFPTTVPLTNGSEIEIHKKRFRFEYPPKEMRPALLATPRHIKSRRSLRMSMIRSAQVFTPRSSADITPIRSRRGSIKDNADWEALKSPIRVSSSGNDDREMMLLEGTGDDAVVVEEEKDLIILEHVDEPEHAEVPSTPSRPPRAPRTPGRAVAFALPSSSSSSARSSVAEEPVRVVQKPPQTPNRRKSVSSLHRAVVLRSAQRVHLERQRQRQLQRYEDEQEEEEVELAVSPERELGPFQLENEDNDQEDGDEESDEEDAGSGSPTRSSPGPLGVIRAGINMVKRLTIDRIKPEEVPLPQDDENSEDDEEEREAEDYEADDDTVQTQTPVRRNFGPFMTPQVVSKTAQRIPVDVRPRASVAHGDASFFSGARRVPVIDSWVNQVVVPELEKERQDPRPKITAEERRAIIQRRKSAVQTPITLPKPAPRELPSHISDDDSDDDTEKMLAKMRQKLDTVEQKTEERKKRLSLASPQKAPGDFSLLATPSAQTARKSLAFRMAEESLKKQEASASTNGDENLVRVNIARISRTPRFDGMRDMFKQPSVEPKTPSFTGLKKLFDGERPTIPKTPAFTGVREMFRTQPAVMDTPRMSFDEIFTEQDEDDYEHDADRSTEQIDDDTVSSMDRLSVKDDDEVEKPEKGVHEVPSIETEDVEDDLKVEPTPAPRHGRRVAKKTPESQSVKMEQSGSKGATRISRRQPSATPSEEPKKTSRNRTRKATTVEEPEAEVKLPSKGRARRAKSEQIEDEAMEIDEAEVEEAPAPKPRRGRVAKTPQTQQTEEPATSAPRTRRMKVEPSSDVDELALTAPPKPTRQKRGTKAKAAESENSINEQEVHPEVEETPVPTTKARASRKGAKKTPIIHEIEEEDKENSEDPAVQVVAKAATRTSRKTPISTMKETVDVPARRTRSRK
ncbi:hypothetical protein M422DRAFT_30724 [Sphaerobolus stellatus SS14]|uniref:FHA domain-containing protein n=1 Tax=Sphaerobolus stellatus (strain SS14) TaxID=990650 RepID=A0A0C9ULP1_SPHS4|nr:hypothetical protein M422DRAFT_30724 [Sphaerobolus stellatus SS14]